MGLHVILNRMVHTTGISPDFGLSMGIGGSCATGGQEVGPIDLVALGLASCILTMLGKAAATRQLDLAAPGRIPPTRCATTAWSPSRSRCIPRRNSIQPWLPRSRQPAMTVPSTWHSKMGSKSTSPSPGAAVSRPRQQAQAAAPPNQVAVASNFSTFSRRNDKKLTFLVCWLLVPQGQEGQGELPDHPVNACSEDRSGCISSQYFLLILLILSKITRGTPP